MQRRDGEVMISFFKAAVSDPPPAQNDSLATSLDDGIADRVVHSVEESQKGHDVEAAHLLNQTDEIANKVGAGGGRWDSLRSGRWVSKRSWVSLSLGEK